MLYRIKLICDEVDGFVREIKIDSQAYFLDLNKCILDSCGYPDDQMTSFFMCNDEWRRNGQQVTREDMGFGGDGEDLYPMADTHLDELIEDEEQHMEFVFDPFSDRSFYMEVVEFIPGTSLDAPVVVRSKGQAPRQIEEDLQAPLATSQKGKKGAVAASESYDDDFYSEGAAFNDDELDLEGFEISDGQPF